MKTKNFNKHAQPVSHPKDAVCGVAVVPFCAKNRCWLLPAGVNQVNRKIYTRTEASFYAKRIDALIRDSFSHRGAIQSIAA